MTHRLASALLVAAGLALPGAALGQPAEDPDWPCIQRKVPELSPIAVWSGPSIDAALERWDDDPAITGLAARLASRRLPLAEAEAEVGRFTASLDAAAKAERLTLLFAGLFRTLDRERNEVMEGIARYARKQRGLAEQIRGDTARLSDIRAAASDPQETAQLNDQVIWSTRIFNERRSSLTYVCETPTLIEQRLFALGRAIEADLAKP